MAFLGKTVQGRLCRKNWALWLCAIVCFYHRTTGTSSPMGLNDSRSFLCLLHHELSALFGEKRIEVSWEKLQFSELNLIGICKKGSLSLRICSLWMLASLCSNRKKVWTLKIIAPSFLISHNLEAETSKKPRRHQPSALEQKLVDIWEVNEKWLVVFNFKSLDAAALF